MCRCYHTPTQLWSPLSIPAQRRNERDRKHRAGNKCRRDIPWPMLSGCRPRSVRRQTTTVKPLTMLSGRKQFGARSIRISKLRVCTSRRQHTCSCPGFGDNSIRRPLAISSGGGYRCKYEIYTQRKCHERIYPQNEVGVVRLRSFAFL
jgi:hypothetical protein